MHQFCSVDIAQQHADQLADAQAKSGTGKTLTYGAIVAELVSEACSRPQALVLEPTRELVLQTLAVVAALLADLPQALSCAGVVGGLPVARDVARLQAPCQVVVGTPGRVRALLEGGHLPVGQIRCLVLDEADHLLTGHGFLDDIATIFAVLPPTKQVMAFSATYSDDILREASALMAAPQMVMLCGQGVALHRIRQAYLAVGCQLSAAGTRRAKQAALADLLGRVAFHQAMLFTNDRDWAEQLAADLSRGGLPTAFLSGSQSQSKRMSIVASVRAFRLRVLAATDLAARGLDLPQVNLVVNLDVPRDLATYMHRIGRTGRFGTSGIAVSLVTPAELETLRGYLADGHGGQLQPLPAVLPSDWSAHPEPQAQLQAQAPGPSVGTAPQHEQAAPDSEAAEGLIRRLASGGEAKQRLAQGGVHRGARDAARGLLDGLNRIAADASAGSEHGQMAEPQTGKLDNHCAGWLGSQQGSCDSAGGRGNDSTAGMGDGRDDEDDDLLHARRAYFSYWWWKGLESAGIIARGGGDPSS